MSRKDSGGPLSRLVPVSGYAPSLTRQRFEEAAARSNWREAFLYLNGLNMFEMLRALDGLSLERRSLLMSQWQNFRGLVNMPRIEYAVTVVQTRNLPPTAPGDLAATGQVQIAAEFLGVKQVPPVPPAKKSFSTHQSVLDNFMAFSRDFEGYRNHMYLDVKGNVTIGIGNLIDPTGEALKLPFRYKSNTGQLASQAEITAEWKLIKSRQELAKKGANYCEPLTNLKLDDAAIRELFYKKLFEFESYLKRQEPFRHFDQWPADAQMGLLSMAWAMGPGFSQKWPKFSAACKRIDFNGAAENCRIKEIGNHGIIRRNNANQLLFRNAAAVIAGEATGLYDRRNLYYPRVL